MDRYDLFKYKFLNILHYYTLENEIISFVYSIITGLRPNLVSSTLELVNCLTNRMEHLYYMKRQAK